MRIGMFTDTYPPYVNGVSTSIATLEKALTECGHEVFIVTVNNDNMTYKQEKNKIKIPGIPIGIYDYRLTGIYSVKAIKAIKKWNLDIIHSHTEFGIGTFSRIVAKQLKIPLIHTYHTMYEDYVHYITKGHFDHASKKVVESLTKFYCDKTAKALIVPTKKTYDLFKDKYKIDNDIYVVPTGINIEKFYEENIDNCKLENLRDSLGLNLEDFVILYTGRLAKEKNVEFLIENHKHFKDMNAKLLIVGSGPDIDKHKELVQKLHLEKNVIFTGKVDYSAIQYYYHLANIFVTASTTETQGLTVVEAMAAGLPVVCVKDESFENIVISDFNGYLFSDETGYKNSIDFLIKNKDSLEKFRQNAKQTAEKYSSKSYAENILSVYKKVIDSLVN